ncbi:hypothetical protein [Legionella pneumophila]|nr:hypothetical protein [Legionella pneumophila]
MNNIKCCKDILDVPKTSIIARGRNPFGVNDALLWSSKYLWPGNCNSS